MFITNACKAPNVKYALLYFTVILWCIFPVNNNEHHFLQAEIMKSKNTTNENLRELNGTADHMILVLYVKYEWIPKSTGVLEQQDFHMQLRESKYSLVTSENPTF